MRICFFRHSLLSRGGDKMVVEHANYLVSRGHDVTIATNVLDTVFEVKAEVHRISRFRSKAVTILKALTFAESYDVIIADIIMMVFFLSFKNKKRLVCFAQDYDESYYKGAPMKWFIRAAYFYCLTLQRIAAIPVSEALGQLLVRRFRANVHVVANGVDTEVFYPDPEYMPLKDGRPVVLVFGRSDYRKGFDLGLRVLARFKAEIDSGALAVWSVGEELDTPFKMRRFGFVTPDRLRKILSASDVLLYPSRHEGLPLFVLEALACGAPVVTTEAVNILTHGVDAVVCPVGDVDCLAEGVRGVLGNVSLKSSLIAGGFSTVKKYTLSQCKRLFEEHIMRLFEP
ncbi:MAG: glycosyltransferase family 4 protein [Nitrospirae bacterium]|uniref:glycosyltransferase family 4 protein n=1 Tax=Candidatus Magnetobacterium casense TaxID=1455061 RepID=UPI00058FCB45|nr:glycosyltransferase family 4 protein [Candidatus Magnetobacterium casensis]MBF0337998.1 glycosyltransferase family 4 protein [Nitrospirota bacterium]